MPLSSLQPKRSDLDMNQHVNNVKYVRWMLEVNYNYKNWSTLCSSLFIRIIMNNVIVINSQVSNSVTDWLFLQTIPDQILEGHQLSGIILEYRRECGSSDIVQSLCEPEEDEILHGVMEPDYCTTLLNGLSLASSSDIINGGGVLTCLEQRPIRYTHLLQTKGEKQNEEIVRGKTTWKRKLATLPFST